MPKFTRQGPKGHKPVPISWSDYDAASIGEFVQLLCDVGASPMFGATTDGGALMVGYLAGSDKGKFYINRFEEIEATLYNILWELDALPTPPVNKATSKPQST